MDRRLVLEFTKMNGAGNDFIVIDNRFYNFSGEELSELASRLCRRRFSVGADGLLAFSRPDDPANQYRMIYYNADGSRGSMCGNGARCLARFAFEAGVEQVEMAFESDAGVYRAEIDRGLERVRLFVQPPRLFREDVPLRTRLPAELGVPYYIWPGVEHVVVFVRDVSNAPVDEFGPAIRNDPALAPAGANVNFVQIANSGDASSLLVRTFEKGVEAETLACGTGAMAAALVARLTRRIADVPVQVSMPGGRLVVGFDVEKDAVTNLYLEGPVESVYRGTVLV